jgi:hypothetical protein
MSHLTIAIPDELAQRLAVLASEQKKSVERVALEQLKSLLEPSLENLPGSPSTIRQVVHELPRLSWDAVNELEQAIKAGRLPMRDEGAFDEAR